jgi:hypothetical protein
MPEPSGRIVDFPMCGDWSCDDDYDWSAVGPTDPAYSAVKREEQLVRYHQPRSDWRRRLQQERDERNGGEPLWVGAEDRARAARQAAEDRHYKWLRRHSNR